MPPEICPACGAEVPPDALACPECGSDETTGWSRDSAVYDGLDLPGGEFDKEEFARHEAGESRPVALWLKVVIALIVAALIFLSVWAGRAG